jgi:nucleotide-binding universal stress UspA family protein
MNKILVTTDLSANSKSAIRFAVQFAKQLKAQLIFYYVAEVTKPTAWSDGQYQLFEKETCDRYCPILKKFVEREVGRQPGAEYKVGLGLNVPETIINAARRNKADFICMSTRGAGIVKKLFGTNASAVITTSSIPVVVVPQRFKATPIDKLFFASDFAAFNKEMKTVYQLADKLRARLDVYHFDYLIDVPEVRKKLEKKTLKYSINKNTSFHFLKLNIEHPLSTHLNKEVKKTKPSLVILFTKQNRKWFDRLLLSSEASEMSFDGRAPLLTFKKLLR